MSVTVNAMPAPAVGGAVNGETTRSGPTRIDRTSWLFSSLLSRTVSAPSATARMKYIPGAVPAGIVTVVGPELFVPGASAGTARLPSRASAGSRTESVEK